MAILSLALMAGGAWAQQYGLSAPPAVGMRAAIDVGWTAPQAKGGLIEVRPAVGNGRRVAYAYANANPQVVEAPEEPGDYVLVLTFDGQDHASQPLRVDPVTASLNGPATVDAGSPIGVAWSGPNNRSDLVTFAERGAAPLRRASYAYVGSSKDGTVRLTAPQDAGDYDIVYVSGKTVLARTPISVGGIAATLSVAQTVPAGGRLRVAFSGPGNNGDLITFATRDGEPISPASYVYTALAEDGAVLLRAFEETGAYDVVYLSGGRVIGRAPVEVVPVAMQIAAAESVPALLSFEVAWQGHGNQGDLIVLALPGQSEGQVYAYIDPLQPRVAMTAPAEAGAYELVYLTQGGRELARRAIAVTPPPAQPGQIEVQFTPGTGFAPGDAVEIILDASGSMLQRQGGERRIEIARRTLAGLLNGTIPAGTPFALRVFGNRQADACRTDLEIPLGPLDPAKAGTVIGGINAVNLAKTPIARSISLAAQDLAGVTGQKVLILITDGEETCEGDPGAAIEALRAGGTDVRVNIVGYAIDDAALARTFRSWAAAGGGAYYDAADGAQLGAALTRAAAPAFTIESEAGVRAAAGRAGDPPVTLPAGRYLVRVGQQAWTAEVAPGFRTVVTP